MTRLVENLTASFSDVPVEHLTEVVAEEYRTLSASRVRDYLPVLVERAVKVRLRSERETALSS